MPFIKTHENLHKNVNENMFLFLFLSKFSCICYFAFFVEIFMKYLQICRTKKLKKKYTILGSFDSFLNWEGANIWPQIRPRKIPGMTCSRKKSLTLPLRAMTLSSADDLCKQFRPRPGPTDLWS